MKIGDEAYVYGHIDEIRNDTIIIVNKGGYFGTVKSEVLTVPPEYARVVRCKDCRFFERDHFDVVYFPTETGEAQRVPLITAHEICTRWGDGCKTSEDGYCFMAERKEE